MNRKVLEKATRRIELMQAAEEPAEDWVYLLHHVATVEGAEELHHCVLVDHLGNLFAVDHLEVDGQIRHVITGLAPDQQVFWSDEEAQEAGHGVPCANRQLG